MRPAIDVDGILAWMGQAQAALRATAWSPFLELDGIDVFDALLWPVYGGILETLRKAGRGGSADAARRMTERTRRLGYRVKRAWQERQASARSRQPQQADVLFWPREITHVVADELAAAALEGLGSSVRFLVCQPKVMAQLQARGIAAVFTRGAWPQRARQARREGARRARALPRLSATELPPFPIGPLAESVEELLWQVLREMLPDVHESVANAQAALDSFRPRVLVVGNDLTHEGRAAALVARLRGVPAVSLMHGSISGNILQRRHCVDRFLVHGEIQRRELLRQGMDDSRIVVCGAPYLDKRPRQTGRVHSAIGEGLAIRPEQAWALAATSGPGERISRAHHLEVIRQLMRLSIACPQITFVARLHRKDRLEYYQLIEKEFPTARLRVVPWGAAGFPDDIFDWLQGCQLVLTGASTVAVEAMLLDVPVVTMDFAGEISEVDFIDAGATQHATDAAALEAAVRRAIESPGALGDVRSRARRYLEDAFLALDGQSAARIANAIRSLGEAHAPGPVSPRNIP